MFIQCSLSARRRALRRVFTFASLVTLLACAPSHQSQDVGSLPDETTTEAEEAALVPQLSATAQKKLSSFREPIMNETQMAGVLAKYDYVDPNHEVPDTLLKPAIAYFDANQDKIDNKNFLSVVDFNRNSKNSRFFIINMHTGAVWTIHVAHGKNSDPDNDGNATQFSNKPNSEMSSLGFYRTAETYSGKHGLSLRLDGLSSTNSNVRSRAVVVHGADYVRDTDVKPGRSWGCLAVSMNNRDKVVNQLKQGSIIYAAVSN